MKFKKLLLSLAPLAIVPTVASTASCAVIEKINEISKQIDGLDWTGRLDGLFTKNDYYIDTVDKTVTYWNATEIIGKDMVIPNYVWYKGEKFKVILDQQCFIYSLNISGTLELNDWVYDIPDNCFDQCANIEEIILHNYPTSIGNDAFNKCLSLSKIVVRKEDQSIDENWALNLKSIGMNAFYHTEIGGDLVFSDKLESIGEDAFFNCFNIETVNLGFCEKLKEIGAWSFSSCSSLTDVYLPASIEKIGDGAFQQCIELKNVHLPSSATTQAITIELCDNAFYACKKFETFLPVTPTVHKIGKNCFYNNDELLYRPWLETKNYPLSVEEAAFGACKFPTITIIPGVFGDLSDQSGDVRKGAFANCQKLTQIDFSSFSDPKDPTKYKQDPPDWSGIQIFDSTTPNGTIFIPRTICDDENIPKPNTVWSEFFETIRPNMDTDGWKFAFK